MITTFIHARGARRLIALTWPARAARPETARRRALAATALLLLLAGTVVPAAAQLEEQRTAPGQAAESGAPPAVVDADADAAAGDEGDYVPFASHAPRPAPGMLEKPDPGHVTMFFYDTPIRDALSEIALQTQTIIIADQSVQGLITCELSNLPLERALVIVLATGGYLFRKMDGFVLVGSGEADSPAFYKFCDTEVFRLRYIGAKDAVGMLPPALAKLATFHEQSNAVVVAAPPEKVALIERILMDCDKPPGQVVLDVRFVVMETGDLQDVGIQWEWPAAQMGTFSDSDLHGRLKPPDSPEWPWGIQLGYTPGKEFTDALIGRLSLLVQNEQATIVANPQVMAQDGKESLVSVTTEEYFEILTRGFYTQSELEKIEVGTKLQITPKIDVDGGITLQMEAEVSDVISRGQGNLPVVTRRQSRNSVRVQDGGTVVVAGLADNRTRLSNQRVPGIGNAPLVGRAFRRDQGGESHRQVLVFVTPRLLREEPPAVADAPVPVRPPAVLTSRAEFEEELRQSLARQRGEGGKP